MIDAEPRTEIRVKVADYAVGRDEQTLITIGLGSCVAIALYDPRTRIGGLAHTLLPSESMAREPAWRLRAGDVLVVHGTNRRAPERQKFRAIFGLSTSQACRLEGRACL